MISNFLHSGNIGDVWASLPSVKTFYEKTGEKATYLLKKDVPAFYYEGAVHPIKDEKSQAVMLNQKMIDMAIPLLKAQEYIEDARVYNGEAEFIDMDVIRTMYVGMPNFSIQRWYFYPYPDFACDLSKDWITIPDAEKDLARGKILINRTERYQNPQRDYSFLKEYEDDCLFIGTMREYNNFCMGFDLQIRKLNVENFLEYAQAIKQCKVYVSNQSQGFQLAEAIHHPRILELCDYAPNNIINGANGYDFFAQGALEYYVKELSK